MIKFKWFFNKDYSNFFKCCSPNLDKGKYIYNLILFKIIIS